FHLTAVFKAVVRTRPADRDPSLIARHLASANQALSVAEERLMSAPFIAADQLTIADISLGHFLYRYFTMEIEQANLPSVFAYYQRLTERPAFAQHVMVDYQGLRPAE
ncbi:MAG: glutathione S-transferase C-terminal domain-containing protein, partial [Pseudomonadota bacterium]